MRSLALSVGQLDEALTPELAASLADALLRVTVAMAAVAQARGGRLTPGCEVLAQLHDLITNQVPAA